MIDNQDQALKLTRFDLLQPWQGAHRAAWDRLREICLGYSVPTPSWRELVATNAEAPDGDVINGFGVSWWDSLELNKKEKEELLGVNQSLVVMPGGGIIYIEAGCFIVLPAGSNVIEG